VSFNTVKRLFRDPYHNVTRDILEKLAKALGVGMAELYEEESDNSEK
jgi:transcriptional regulator with XRE-family HTH domain